MEDVLERPDHVSTCFVIFDHSDDDDDDDDDDAIDSNR
jgi:hypothetical protein